MLQFAVVYFNVAVIYVLICINCPANNVLYLLLSIYFIRNESFDGISKGILFKSSSVVQSVPL